MSVFQKLKSALGFAPSEEDEEELNELLSDDNEEEQPALSLTEQEVDNSPKLLPAPAAPQLDEALPGKIFDDMIRLFNEWQPEFVSRCLNTEAQRRYIFEAMDAGVRKSLEEAVEAARAHAQAMVECERRRASDELAALKKQNESLDEKRQAMKSAQLSAERQKRALSDRVHDLEGQVAQLEADKEQYQLENRSMLNKLRLATMDLPQEAADVIKAIDGNEFVGRKEHDEEVAQLKTQLDETRKELEEAKEELAARPAQTTPPDATGQADSAKADDSKSDAGKSDTDTAQTTDSDEVAALREEIEQLKAARQAASAELAAAQMRMKELDDIRKRRDVMVAEANAASRRLRQQSENNEKELNRRIDELTRECEHLKETLDRVHDSSMEQNDMHRCEADALRARVREAEERFEAAKVTVVEAEQRAMEAVATPPKRRRGRPKKSEMKRYPEPVAPTLPPSAGREVEFRDHSAIDMPPTGGDTLTVADSPLPIAAEGLPDYDNVEQMLPRESDRPVASEASVASKRKVKPAISAIDELLDGSDWMTASVPPQKEIAKQQTKEPSAEDDFGYKAPPRRHHIDDEAQMSLW